MNINQYISIVKFRLKIFIIVFLTIIVSITSISFLLPKEYTSEISIVVDADSQDPITSLPVSAGKNESYIATQSEIITSHNNAKKVVKILGLENASEIQAKFNKLNEKNNLNNNIEDWLSSYLLKNIEIKPSKDNNVITLSYTAEDPVFASAAAKAFISAYQETIIENRTRLAHENKIFFSAQLKELQKEFESAQSKYSSFQQRENILGRTDQLDIETQKLSDLTTQYINAKSQLIDVSSKSMDQENSNSVIQPDVVNNPYIIQLKGQLSALQSQLSSLSSKEGPNHPEYKKLQAQTGSIQYELKKQEKLYSDSMEVIKDNAAKRETELKLALESQKQKVLLLKKYNDELDILKRDVDNADKVYNLALQKVSEFSMQSNIKTTNVSILKNAPVPMSAAKPNILINIVFSVLMGGFVGLIVVFLLESKDRRIRNANDISVYLGISVIAELTE